MKRSFRETLLKSVLSDYCKLLAEYRVTQSQNCPCVRSTFPSDILPGSCFLKKSMALQNNSNEATINIHEIMQLLSLQRCTMLHQILLINTSFSDLRVSVFKISNITAIVESFQDLEQWSLSELQNLRDASDHL